MDLGVRDSIINYVREIIKDELRIDRRKLMEYRPIKIIKNFIKNAEGSCYVEFGNTKVLAGIKFEIGEPFEDKPDEGIFITNVELSPMAFPTIDPGPSDLSIEYSRIVDRIIRESRFIDLKKLVIEPGKYVWTTFIDIYVLDDDGNIIDASVLAAVCSLLNAKLPKLEKVVDKYKIDPKVKTENIPLNKNIPVMVTFAKIDDKFIVDPNKYEEDAADMIIHIGITDKIHALQTRRSGKISLEEFMFLTEQAERFKNYLLEKIR